MAAFIYPGMGDYYPYATTVTSSVVVEFRKEGCNSTFPVEAKKPIKDKLHCYRNFISDQVQNCDNVANKYATRYNFSREPRNSMSSGQRAKRKRNRRLHELVK